MKFNLAAVAAAAVAAMIFMSAGKAAVDLSHTKSASPDDVSGPLATLRNTTVISKDGDPYFDLHAEPSEREVGVIDLCILSDCIDV